MDREFEVLQYVIEIMMLWCLNEMMMMHTTDDEDDVQHYVARRVGGLSYCSYSCNLFSTND